MPPGERDPNCDQSLLTAACAGQPTAVRQLVERLAPRIERIVFRLTGWHHDCEDIVQDVFMIIWRTADQFRGDCRLETWAIAIAVNRCRMWRRAAARQAAELGDEPLCDRGDRDRLQSEVQEEMRLAISLLDDHQRELIVLRYLEQLGLDEIADLLDIRKNTLEVRLLRARKKLGEIIAARQQLAIGQSSESPRD